MKQRIIISLFAITLYGVVAQGASQKLDDKLRGIAAHRLGRAIENSENSKKEKEMERLLRQMCTTLKNHVLFEYEDGNTVRELMGFQERAFSLFGPDDIPSGIFSFETEYNFGYNRWGRAEGVPHFVPSLPPSGQNQESAAAGSRDMLAEYFGLPDDFCQRDQDSSAVENHIPENIIYGNNRGVLEILLGVPRADKSVMMSSLYVPEKKD